MTIFLCEIRPQTKKLHHSIIGRRCQIFMMGQNLLLRLKPEILKKRLHYLSVIKVLIEEEPEIVVRRNDHGLL